ncbi:MAG: bifunctional DNA primase/polymerase [Desulfobulbia bacterium]
MEQRSTLEAALAYLAKGWSVIPAAKRGKRPIVRWRAYQDGLPTKEQVRKWFRRWPKANLSVVTGAVSGIVVLDVDPNHGGKESLEILEERHGTLPKTVESLTGGDGRHLYFSYPGHEVRNRAGMAPGLDLRGDGGVIIVPPSIHPSGNPYIWKPGHGPEEIELAPLPIWLIEPRFGLDGQVGKPLTYWRKLVKEGINKGQRNTALASFTGHLLWHGVDPDVVMELMLAWNRVRCNPPLDDKEVILTVQSIQKTHRHE